MNVFATSPDPLECAVALDDKRVGKMLIESNQLLSNALRVHGVDHASMCRASHMNHPLTAWTAEHCGNFNWLLHHALYLADEWIYRFGRKHGSASRCDAFSADRLTDRLPYGRADGFVNCAASRERGLDFRSAEVHEAYRSYLAARWAGDVRPPEWTKRGMPVWTPEEVAGGMA